MTNLITLSNSHVTQYTVSGIKGPWKVYANGDDKKALIELPSNYREDEVFSIMGFAKEYELEAFNSGIKFGKEKTLKVYKPKLEQAEKRIELMKEENERLAAALENIYHSTVEEV